MQPRPTQIAQNNGNGNQEKALSFSLQAILLSHLKKALKNTSADTDKTQINAYINALENISALPSCLINLILDEIEGKNRMVLVANHFANKNTQEQELKETYQLNLPILAAFMAAIFEFLNDPLKKLLPASLEQAIEEKFREINFEEKRLHDFIQNRKGQYNDADEYQPTDDNLKKSFIYQTLVENNALFPTDTEKEKKKKIAEWEEKYFQNPSGNIPDEQIKYVSERLTLSEEMKNQIKNDPKLKTGTYLPNHITLMVIEDLMKQLAQKTQSPWERKNLATLLLNQVNDCLQEHYPDNHGRTLFIGNFNKQKIEIKKLQQELQEIAAATHSITIKPITKNYQNAAILEKIIKICWETNNDKFCRALHRGMLKFLGYSDKKIGSLIDHFNAKPKDGITKDIILILGTLCIPCSSELQQWANRRDERGSPLSSRSARTLNIFSKQN